MLKYLHKLSIEDQYPVFFRYILPADKDFIKIDFESLSFKSKYLRFVSPTHTLSEKWLDYLVNDDHCNHCAIIAFGRYGENNK